MMIGLNVLAIRFGSLRGILGRGCYNNHSVCIWGATNPGGGVRILLFVGRFRWSPALPTSSGVASPRLGR